MNEEASPNNRSLSELSFPNPAIDACTAFYKLWDSESEDNSDSFLKRSDLLNKNEFERFKEEYKLAYVDRVSIVIEDRRKPQAPPQMFQTCDYLLTKQNLELSSNPQSSCASGVVEDDEHFDIQTEWLSVEDVVEEADRSLDETLKPATPQHNKSIDTTFLEISQPKSPKTSIVEQILEDFCADLSDEEDDREYEPYFRFRKRPIRTYERRFRCAKRVNIETGAKSEAESVVDFEDDDEYFMDFDMQSLIKNAETPAATCKEDYENGLDFKEKHKPQAVQTKQPVPDKQEQLDEEILAKIFEKEEFTEELNKFEKEHGQQAPAFIAKQQLVQENLNLSNTDDYAAQKPFMGFRTGNAKEIHVSEQARKKAAQIFAELPDLPKELKGEKNHNK